MKKVGFLLGKDMPGIWFKLVNQILDFMISFTHLNASIFEMTSERFHTITYSYWLLFFNVWNWSGGHDWSANLIRRGRQLSWASCKFWCCCCLCCWTNLSLIGFIQFKPVFFIYWSWIATRTFIYLWSWSHNF